MKKAIGIAALCGLMPLAASAAIIIHGPTDYNAGKNTLTAVDTIAASELTGVGDQVVITYTVNYVAGLNVNNSFVGLTINDYTTPSAIWDVNGGLAGIVVRTGRSASHGSHALYTFNNGGGTTWRTAQGLSSGQAHAVRITISGFSDGNGFNGVRSVLLEIDEHSSTFNTADISATRTMDFGTTDEMKLRLHAHDTGLDVDGFTVVIPTLITDTVDSGGGWSNINGGYYTSGVGGLTPQSGANFWTANDSGNDIRGAWKLFNTNFTAEALMVTYNMGDRDNKTFPDNVTAQLFADTNDNGSYDSLEEITSTTQSRPAPSDGWATWKDTYTITETTTTDGNASVIGKKIGFVFFSQVAGGESLNFDNLIIQKNVTPTSSGVDLRAYQAADGVYVEFVAYDVEADGTIRLAQLNDDGTVAWEGSVAVTAGPRYIARFLVPELEPGGVYNFSVRDEVGKWWSVDGVTVGSFDAELVSASLTGITITFDSIPENEYEIQWAAELGDSWVKVAEVSAASESTSVEVAYPDPEAPSGVFRVVALP